MEIREKIARSWEPLQFTLHREDSFYVCYFADVMLFSLWIQHSSWYTGYEESMDLILLQAKVPEAENEQIYFEHIRKCLNAYDWKDYGDYVVFSLRQKLKTGYSIFERGIFKSLRYVPGNGTPVMKK